MSQVFSILARNRRELVKLAILSREYLRDYHRDTVHQYSYRVEGDGVYKPLETYYLGRKIHRSPDGPFGPGPAIIDEKYELWYQFGKLHRIAGPACVNLQNSDVWEWWCLGKRHRADGPAMSMRKGSVTTLTWYLDGEKCRFDGPAVVRKNQTRIITREWYQFGMRHRANGPAIIGENYRTYYVFGKLHRISGPAHRCNGPCIPGRWHCRGGERLTAARERRNKCEWTESWFCHGKLHRFWDWAVETSLDEKIWYHRGEIHRKPGPNPAHITINGKLKWYRHGKLHRRDGPAVIDGYEEFWYRSGLLHRPESGPNSGPACITYYGNEWIQKGCLFRENGVADEINMIWSHGFLSLPL